MSTCRKSNVIRSKQGFIYNKLEQLQKLTFYFLSLKIPHLLSSVNNIFNIFEIIEFVLFLCRTCRICIVNVVLSFLELIYSQCVSFLMAEYFVLFLSHPKDFHGRIWGLGGSGPNFDVPLSHILNRPNLSVHNPSDVTYTVHYGALQYARWAMKL